MPVKTQPLPAGGDPREILAKRLRLESTRRPPRVRLAVGGSPTTEPDAYADAVEILDVQHREPGTLVKLRIAGVSPLPTPERPTEDAEASIQPFALMCFGYAFHGKAAVLGWNVELERQTTEIAFVVGENIAGHRLVNVPDTDEDQGSHRRNGRRRS